MDRINYEDAVAEAKQITEQWSKDHWRLGELADRLEPKYGEQTLKRFAEEIGIADCTLERHRDVFRAWKEIAALGRQLPSYSVARELATHPQRDEIVANNPTITKAEAAELMRRYRSPPSTFEEDYDDETTTDVLEDAETETETDDETTTEETEPEVVAGLEQPANTPERNWQEDLLKLAQRVLWVAMDKQFEITNPQPGLAAIYRRAAVALIKAAAAVEQQEAVQRTTITTVEPTLDKAA